MTSKSAELLRKSLSSSSKDGDSSSKQKLLKNLLPSQLQGKHRMANEIQYAPLRSLDDFILSEARFQLPNLSDFEKWGNRVVKNLLYYQTNYGILILVWLLVCFMIHLDKALLSAGIIVATILGAAFGPRFIQATTPKNVKILIYVSGALSLYFMELVVFVMFILLVPWCLIFVHSSLRLRNIKNKLMNVAENVGVTTTPMGIFLSEMGLLPEGITS